MAAPAAAAAKPDSRFVTSRTGTKHTYVRLKPRPELKIVVHKQRASDGAPWVERSKGKVCCKYVPERGAYCLVLLDETTPVLEVAVSAELAFDQVDDGADKGIVWGQAGEQDADVPPGPKTDGLFFSSLAALAPILEKVRSVVLLCHILPPGPARTFWFSNFGRDDKVEWARFYPVFKRAQTIPEDPQIDDQIKALLLMMDSTTDIVSVESFSNFVQWFGPFDRCFQQWYDISRLGFFHGTMSREAAEDALKERPVHSFLVRISDPGFFSISYKDAPHPDDDAAGVSSETEGHAEVLHIRVQNVGNGFAMQTEQEELMTYPTLTALIASQSHMFNHGVNSMPFDRDFADSLSSREKKDRDSSAAPASDSPASGERRPSMPSLVVAERPLDPNRKRLRREFDFNEDGWLEGMLALCKSDDKSDRVHAGKLAVSWVEVDAQKHPFVTKGGLALIGALADFNDDPVIERLAVRALCALAGQPRNRMSIVEEVLPSLYKFAQSPDEQVQQYAAFIFANLVLNDAQVQRLLIERDCLSSLNKLASSPSTYVQANIAWVFGNLAQHETNKKVILLGGLQALFKLSQSDNEKVKKYAFDALGCLGIVDGDDVSKLIAQVKQSLDVKPVWEIEFKDLEDLVLVDSGGYGNVYMAKYLHMRVAVKRLKKSQLRDLEAFKAEIATMSKLRHPNIVLFIGATTSPLTIVTEYMARKSLFDVIHDSAVDLHSRLVLKMVQDGALGMMYLHNFNIIHRDLKSLNLLVDDSFNVKLTDFGLSRVLSQDTTMTPHGTYAWRPPEMFRSEAYDRKVDVYSFGIVLWELITRQIPFDGLPYETIKKNVLGGVRPDIPRSDDAVIQEITDLMKACWETDSKLRPDFGDICEGLAELCKLVDEPRS